MLTSEITFAQTNSLNLLLKQQVVKHIEEIDEPLEEIEYKELDITKALKLYSEDAHDEVKICLANVQVEESALSNQHKARCDTYDLLETVLEHVLQHAECVMLEVRSANRLALVLNSFAVRENYANEAVSAALSNLCRSPGLELLEDIRTKLFVCLNGHEKIRKLRQEYERRRNNYNLALKNFKIILEVINVSDTSLVKLKKQFDDVLENFQQCRRVLDEKLPSALTERTKVLKESMTMLGGECSIWGRHRSELSSLLRKLGSTVSVGEYDLRELDELKGGK
nr:unnamed protein product [Callosobruchus chinensis]